MRAIFSAACLLAALCPSAFAEDKAPAIVHFTVDTRRDVKPISRFIYGVNQPLDGPYARLTFTRLGGNRWTAYNWTNNASNAGNDYHFQSDGYLGGGDVPGGAMIAGIENARARGAGILLTVPMAGYVAADKKGGGDVRAGGPDYLQTRFRAERARKGAAFTLTPDPAAPVVFQDEFVHWVKSRYPYGEDDPNCPIWFDLDNEPDLWSATHAEVHPERLTYAELIEKTIDYARAIKDVAPKAKVFGPANYGWQGFVSLQNAPDAGGRDFQAVYLERLAEAERKEGRRLLDVLDVHWYPEATGGGTRITEQATTKEVNAARMQAPRSLWDAEYVETSWIAKFSTKGPIKLLPRLREKLRRAYPGTALSVSEYNYGGGADVSGAIAQADVLGIFGREGVFAANEWPLAKREPFIAAAFQLYRDFDGKGGAFGDTSIFAAMDDVASTSVYASVDSAGGGRLVLVAINKTDRPLEARVTIDGGKAYARAEAYVLTSASAKPRRAEGAAPAIDAQGVTCALPPLSVNTIVLTNP